MFVLSKTGRYFWPVTISLPVTGGKFEKSSFDAEFKRLPQSKLRRLLDASGDGALTDFAFCSEFVCGWRGIQDESGAEVPFSETALSELVEIPGVAKALGLAYLESLSGSKVKN